MTWPWTLPHVIRNCFFPPFSFFKQSLVIWIDKYPDRLLMANYKDKKTAASGWFELPLFLPPLSSDHSQVPTWSISQVLVSTKTWAFLFQFWTYSDDPARAGDRETGSFIVAEQLNSICQAPKWETRCWWSQKKKKLLCIIFLLFTHPKSSFSFSSPSPSPPSLPADSLETRGKEAQRLVSQGKPTPLNIQNIEYEMSEELSINLTLMAWGVSFVSTGCERGFSEPFTDFKTRFTTGGLWLLILHSDQVRRRATSILGNKVGADK